MLGDLRRLLVAPDDDVWEGLIVPEGHIVTRLEALDEVGFEKKRLGFSPGIHELHRRRRADHRRDAVCVSAEPCVVLDAILQVPRLADINDLARLIHHAIDAGACAEMLDVARNDLRPGLRRAFAVRILFV